MSKISIKKSIFLYNLIIVITLITLVAVIFNIAINIYFKNDIIQQLNKIANRTEETALKKGPDFFPPKEIKNPPPIPPEISNNIKIESNKTNDEIFRFYLMLDRSLREPLSVLNANYILLDLEKKIITPTQDEYFKPSKEVSNKILQELSKVKNIKKVEYLNFNLSGTNYIALIKQVSQKNTFGLGYIVIYSSLKKINQLQIGIYIILFIILIFSALIIIIPSSLSARKITKPFATLNQHIEDIAERNFGKKIEMPVYKELQEFVNSINIMSEKLEIYDKAQKTFLQNASHEFRTPLMSIQSYAEGIKYNVVETNSAVEVILSETKRMTQLVEDLLYLSRLEAIEENYHFQYINLDDLINNCINHLSGIALNNNITINYTTSSNNFLIRGDEEKLLRAFSNVLSNCIRYAESNVTIESKLTLNEKVKVTISDDGPGINEKDLPFIFERFYKGKKGNFGLGLAISKNIIEKHKGTIYANNSNKGAVFTIELPIK
ncbi:sensor histidine kinase [Caldicellulosiruptoraceae bacterium PP1]